MVYLTMSMQGMIPYLNSTNTKWEAHLTIEIRKETNVKLKCYWNGWTWNDLIISWFSANPNEWNLMADSVFFFLAFMLGKMVQSFASKWKIAMQKERKSFLWMAICLEKMDRKRKSKWITVLEACKLSHSDTLLAKWNCIFGNLFDKVTK